MRIWLDILTPKQLLFFESIVKRLRKRGDRVLLTSRRYREVNELAKIRGIITENYGVHGGKERLGKLEASINRMDKLAKRIAKFKPDLTISFCSPEASRISFGLGIPHIAFCDSPHATAVMKLAIPLVQKLLVPFYIPKREFTQYGINPKDIIQYKAVDAYLILKNRPALKNSGIPDSFRLHDATILVRTGESQASYFSKKVDAISMINMLSENLDECNILILGRYAKEIQEIKKKTSRDNVIVLDRVVDSGMILSMCDVFVGSGGTMTAEAALRGIPTISYNNVPNIVEKYLVRKGVVKRANTPKQLLSQVKKLLDSDKSKVQKRSKKLVQSMEDPYSKILRTINLLKIK